jgi:hypothetical protein
MVEYRREPGTALIEQEKVELDALEKVVRA